MKNLKFYLGISLFALSFFMPLIGFWIASLPLPAAVKGTMIGLVTFGGPEVCVVAAVALLGKEAFDLISSKLLSFLGQFAPKGSVSKTRYKIGLVLFILPVIPSYIMGYAPEYLPDSSPLRLYVSIASDLMFITSLFVLGGDFWDKLRSLFVYDARAQFPHVSNPADHGHSH